MAQVITDRKPVRSGRELSEAEIAEANKVWKDMEDSIALLYKKGRDL